MKVNSYIIHKIEIDIKSNIYVEIDKYSYGMDNFWKVDMLFDGGGLLSRELNTVSSYKYSNNNINYNSIITIIRIIMIKIKIIFLHHPKIDKNNNININEKQIPLKKMN